MVPLAWAFRSAGHEVRVAGQPPVVDAIVASGLTAVPVGASYDLMAGITEAGDIVRREMSQGPSASGDTSSMSPEAFRRYAEMRTVPHVRTALAMADELVDHARYWRPDLVVSDPITMVAPLVAEVAGAPLVHHLWGYQPPSLAQFPGYGLDPDRWPADLRACYERFGAEPRAHHGIATVDPGPATLQPAGVPKRLPARYMSFNGSGAVPEWLRSPGERPRICLSWLTANTVSADSGVVHPVTTLIDALAGLDVETVVAVRGRDRENLGRLPGNARVVEDMPLNIILPTCAVAVNHGGTGTILTAACSGVPQVVVPYNPGLAAHAECLAETGAGLVLPADPINPGEVADAVASMLGAGAFRKAAGALREENLALPVPTQVMRAIEELVR
ncbi:nucleotide disphospho-sugar-binding domain-containing protein [Streptomyces sp. NPDC048516]|uniref:nucleotide disphospho-sugar-binding domain-containing protein n=1 Tax=Streptomyces sp. NPDC048516 TaxID=3365565 RepID=UPI0037208DF0